MCAWLCITLCATFKLSRGPQSLVSLFWGSRAKKFGNHWARVPLELTKCNKVPDDLLHAGAPRHAGTLEDVCGKKSNSVWFSVAEKREQLRVSCKDVD